MKKHLLSSILLFTSFLGCQKEESSTSTAFPIFTWGFSVEGFPITKSKLDKINEETKIPPQLVQFYLQWPSSPKKFESITSSLESIASTGAIPCITWEPMTVIDGKMIAIPYEQILNGDYDTYLLKIAAEIEAWGEPIIIRFAHEMNLDHYHWGGTLEEYNINSPKHYAEMFRYVVSLFKKHNITNGLWAFCPNNNSVPNLPWNTPRNYYPGDNYVDLLGMDGYNWDITPQIAKKRNQAWDKPWSSFEDIFTHLYRDLKKIAPHKPIIVFETASVDREGKRKSAWIKDAIKTAKKWGLLGIVWFQVNKEEDWRINQHDDFTYIPLIRTSINPIQGWAKEDIRNRMLKSGSKAL